MTESSYRQRRRFRVAFPLRIRPRDQHNAAPAGTASEEVESAVTQDLSSGGCYFWLAHPIPLGSFIEMEIHIPPVAPVPQGMTLRCQAKVLRIETGKTPGKVGVACQIRHYSLAAQAGARERQIAVA